MKYICLVYMEEATLTSVPDSECMAFGESIHATGNRRGGEALRPAATAKTIRVRKRRISVTDGPFAETKEQLAGFYLVDAETFDEAIAIASRIPPARVGSIEVREVRELEP
ncbi:MAG TPA: YciI family protein [Rhodothermales bacterium]|nr:YciI family protein [Rhodothermales bacterium]